MGWLQDISSPEFSSPVVNPELCNSRLMVDKSGFEEFMFEKSGVEETGVDKLMVEKSGFEEAGVKAWGS